jgi:hypothetical protein
MKDIISIINLFKNDYVEFYPPVENSKILETERLLKLKLPNDYVEFLSFSNGVIIDGDELLGIGNKQNDLLETYKREHFATKFPMVDYILPFSPDGRGNFYCFDLKENNIIFWVNNYLYNENDKPEVVYSNFHEWFNEVMIEWVIENNDRNELFKNP